MRFGARVAGLAMVWLAVGACRPDDGIGTPTGWIVDQAVAPVDMSAGFSVFDEGPPPPPPPFDAGFPSGPQPQFGATVAQPDPPPPLSGGTLLALADGKTAVAADPDRDLVYLVDVPTQGVRTVALMTHDEPGRVASDGTSAFVALRRGGAVVTLDLASGAVTDRRAVCAAPRGVAWDATRASLWVACVGGELVELPSSGPAKATYTLAPDLRDVVVADGQLYVSQFRSATMFAVDPATGAVKWSARPPDFKGDTADGAWRLVANPGGGVVMLHQEVTTGPVSTMPGGYGQSGIGGIVMVAVTPFDATGSVAGGVAPQFKTALAVDIAIRPSTVSNVAAAVLVNAGNAFTPALQQLGSAFGAGFNGTGSSLPGGVVQATSAAYLPDGTLLVQSREPAELLVFAPFAPAPSTIGLSSLSRADTGHDVFHANAGGFVACASCHLEGGDDGRTWQFENLGPRRTPSLRFGITGTEPFHWGGEMQDLPTLAFHVFVERMSGPKLADDQIAALRHFLDGIPQLPRPVVDAAAAMRGQALFEDTSGADCVACHSGPKLTNNKTLDVGTGGAFQVPSLIGVAAHPPYLHDGRAATLAARFDPKLGGGDHHGTTSQLTQQDIADLVAYLETL